MRKKTGLVVLLFCAAAVAGCGSVGVGFSIPIGGFGGIGVGVNSDGTVSGTAGVGSGGASVGVGGSTTLPRSAQPAASAASATR